MSNPPTFAQWHRSVHGYYPFPWQQRCADEILAGNPPDVVAVETGCGKSTVMDAFVWAAAADAQHPPEKRRVPTRLWWVTPRRALVDDASRRARLLSRTLAARATEASAAVAELLRSRSGDSPQPLETVTLRGGLSTEERGSLLPYSATQPAVIVSTVPMFGSRLLFRAYGTSPALRPVAAAMAGVDSLVVCDEAHLLEALQQLVAEMGEHDTAARPVLPQHRSQPKVIAVTATTTVTGNQFRTLRLDPSDHSKRLIKQRVGAAKTLTVKQVRKEADTAEVLADTATGLLGDAPGPTSCLVFANTPRVAREAFQRIDGQKTTAGITEVLLATGRMRPPEADNTAARIKGLIGVDDVAPPGEGHVVIVATQTLEVGADLDAGLLVTEACGPRALIQRLGRLNRLGKRPTARAVWVQNRPSGGRWPVYGEIPGLVHQTLTQHNSPVDVSPSAVTRLLAGIPEPGPRRPSVTHAQVAAWRKTSIPVDADPPVEPYFAGIDNDTPRIRVAWRLHLPEPAEGTRHETTDPDPERLWPPIQGRETVELPLPYTDPTVHQWLTDLARLWIRARPDHTAQHCQPAALRAGDTIIIDATAGGYNKNGWWPDTTETVTDLTCQQGYVTLTKQVTDQLLDDPTDRTAIHEALQQANHDESDDDDRQTAANKAAELLAATLPHVENTPAKLIHPHWRIEPASRTQPPDREDQRSAANRRLPTLAQHSEEAATEAARTAAMLGMPTELSEAASAAARYHDTGKTDPRFQAWLRAGDEPMAKSNTPWHLLETTRIPSGWPKGGRHEALSARALTAAARQYPNRVVDYDLVAHLVAAHHGHGRPLIRPVTDNTHITTPEIRIDLPGIGPVTIPTDLTEIDWDQPRRFAALNEQYGTHGLALLEAVVRYADWQVSDPTYTPPPGDPA